MIVNLIKTKQMFSLTLPNKVKGQYWVSDIDENGKPRDLISIEAVDEKWILKSNKFVSILNAENKPVKNTVLKPSNFFNLKIVGSDEIVKLFTESIDESRQSFRKVVIRKPDSIYIGRTDVNNLCYENKFVSSKHARLNYDGSSWSILDMGSTNGTYVNGYRIESKNLSAGDHIYIMGLRIVIGHNFLAINNPDNLVKLNSASLYDYVPQKINFDFETVEFPEKDYFFRSPRFHREIEPAQITIDPPPQIQKMDTVPLALMLGPSITMGMTSVSTALLTINNVITRVVV